MSYILEALRRSQAERERGRVPGLDAQPASGPADQDAARRLPATWIGGGVAAAALLAATLAAVWWMRAPPAAPLASPPSPRADGAPRPVQLPAPAPAVQPPVQPPLPQVVSAPTTPPAPPAVQPAPAPAPARSGLSSTTATPQPPALPAAPQQAQSPSPQPQPQPQAQPQTTSRAVPLAELSADQRRELPAMVIGGSIWSDSAANRFVIVNGQLVREGEAAAPGATLERIGPKSLVLRWRDLRVEVPL